MRPRSAQPFSEAGAPPRSTRALVVRLFATCWLVFGLHFATNSVRELFPAITLGERLSVDVSEYLGLHPDIFALPGRGAFINNNPGASILGALPYGLVHSAVDRVVERVQQLRASGAEPDREYDSIYPLSREFYRAARERGLDVKLGLAAGATQVLMMAPLAALSAVIMFRILLSRIGATRPALLLTLLYAFATPILFRTAQLNHNVLVSHCALFSFALLWQPWADPTPGSRVRYLLAGALAGWAVVLDYSGVLVPASLGLYILARRAPRVDVLRFGAGVAASLAVLAAYQWIAFGNPLYPAQRYMPPTPLSSYGYNGMGWPQLDLLWETAFGLHFGLFAFAPILLLALYPPAWLDRRLRLIDGREAWLCAGLSVALFLFAAGNEYGRLQFNSGVRYVVPAVPFLFLIAAGVLRRLPLMLGVLIGIGSTYWSWCLAMYRDVEQSAGVLEAVRHITFEGPRLPWLTTLEHLGYASHDWTFPVLGLAGIAILLIWTVGGRPSRPTSYQPVHIASRPARRRLVSVDPSAD